MKEKFKKYLEGKLFMWNGVLQDSADSIRKLKALASKMSNLSPIAKAWDAK